MKEVCKWTHSVAVCIVVLVTIVFSGCTTTPLVKDSAEKYWPPAPEQPRIKFLDYYSDRWHLSKKGQSWAESMFGKVEERLFLKPYGIAVSPDGNRIYVADTSRVLVLDIAKGETTTIGDVAGPGNLSYPFGITLSKSGKLYVADLTRKRVVCFDTDGKYLSVIGTNEQLKNPTAVAVDEERKLVYVVDSKAHDIKVFNIEGKLLRKIGGTVPSFDEGHFNFPANILVSPEGEVYVVDSGNFRIQVFGPEGEFRRKWGRVGDMPGEFARPRGIAMDSEEHVYVVDGAFQNLQLFTKRGQPLMWFGEGGQGLGQFRLPSAVAIDASDRIYTIEQVRPRVQIFQLLNKKYWEANLKEKTELEKRLGVTISLDDVVAPPPPVAPAPPAAAEPVVEDKTVAGGEPAAEGMVEEPKPLSPQADLLVRMLEVKYGKLSKENRARIEAADPDSLLKWGVRVFSAEKIDQVFGE